MTVQDTQYDLHRVEQDESKGRQNDAAQDDRREQARAPDHGQEKHGKPQKPERDPSEKNDDPVVNKSRRRILSSRPKDFHLQALPEPCMTLSSHTAPDVRPFP